MKKIFSAVCALCIAVCICGCSAENGETGLKHVVKYETGDMSDFSDEKESRILEAFEVVFPENESDAYIHAFVREYDVRDGAADGVYFWLEIGGVKDYDAFFKANEGRVKKTVIEPTDDPDTEENEAETGEPEIIYENRSMNEEQSFVEGMTTGEYFITYGLYCSLKEDVAYPETYEFMQKLNAVYSDIEKSRSSEKQEDSENG